MSLNAYQRARAIAETPRAMEYRLMSQITGDMIDAHDAGLQHAALMPALHRNREVWSTFSNLCASPDNQLPAELRARIISIALWVERHTGQVVRGQASIEDLISVNRTLIEGLAPENVPAR
ncbi:flagellar biosynthesis regulator FlaF [Sphingobium boeckii]|uniref:Flagellar protein FlaF n=1 Tax=Sphingobium boeckii TaxID=1082345 RepID=A0A7W9AGT5_9SPHN|nr:flagellar biosynthesis regulator FlaF [Sphingobium boeckii]MBB5685241.1 flagellar protein FlaF [Sphingobium boeckii]